MSCRVLLVEDSPMINGALKLLLESGGFDVTLATSVGEAAAWDGTSPPDVMLLDLSLPDGDGLEVIDALDARGLRPETTFAMTGYTDAATHQRCIAAGCSDVLIKPVPVHQLLRIVASRHA